MYQEEQRLWKEITGFGRGLNYGFILRMYQEEYRIWMKIIGRVRLNMMLCYGWMRNMPYRVGIKFHQHYHRSPRCPEKAA